MGKYAAIDAPDIDSLVEESASAIGRAVDSLAIPKLKGVVLGGGYARGEGGVRVLEDGSRKLSNDLDFYVVAEEGSNNGDLAAIGEALRPVSEEWTRKLGVDVDFCGAKTPWRLKHDEKRLMIQELVHGYCDIAGEKGESLFSHVARLEPKDLPWMEAARLLLNRGAGLLLSLATKDNRFIVRNINKAILGAGDARLIAKGRYAWRAVDRAKTLASPLYSAAVDWKFLPKAEAVASWDEARKEWLAAKEEVFALGGKEAGRRTLREAARWIARRKSLGELSSTGLDCTLRALKGVERRMREKRPMDESLKRDWEIFN